MTYVLVLTLVLASGPKQSFVEVASLTDCWRQASAVFEKFNAVKMKEAEILGIGAGCYGIPIPGQAL